MVTEVSRGDGTRRRRLILIIVGAVVVFALILLVIFFVIPRAVPVALDTVSPSPSASATATPSATPVANPLPADAFAVVTVLATDASGAQLDLRMVVHQPVSKTDPAVASDLAAFASTCASEPNWTSISADPDSGMETLDVTATQRGTIGWPSTSEIEIFPLTDGFHPKLPSGTGIEYGVAEHNEVPQPTHCFDTFSVFGEADGSFSMYMYPRPYAGQPLGSPNLYLWNILQYGFVSFDDAHGITFSDCSIELTPAAQAFGLTDNVWLEYNTDAACAGGDFGF